MHELIARRLAEGQAFRVKVIPKSPRTEVAGELADGTVKIRVAAAPERGKANAALCAFLERETGLRAEVLSGQTSPLKLVRLS